MKPTGRARRVPWKDSPMPRTAHRPTQRDRAAMCEAILDAAEKLLHRDVDGTGIPPLTLGDVAKEVGLARSSLYRYYAGVEDLIEAVAMRGFPEWADGTRREVEEALAKSGPRAGVLTFVESNMRRAPDGKLRWRHQLLRVHLDEIAHRRVLERHQTATTVLAECVADMPGVSEECRANLLEALRSLVSAAVLVAADHPEDVAAHIRLYTAAAAAMIDEVLTAG